MLDQERLYRNSRLGRAIEARLAANTSVLLAENKRIEAALEREERDLTEQRGKVSAAAFAPLADAFDQKAESIRKTQRDKSRLLSRRYEAERKRFQDVVRPILAEVLQSAGAVAIIDSRALILSFETLDMTDEAITLLDERLGDGVDLPPLPDPPPEPGTEGAAVVPGTLISPPEAPPGAGKASAP